MKSEVITEVNKIGKAGQIVVRIGKVIIWLALAICLAAGIIFMVIPKDMVVIDMEHKTTVGVNLSEMDTIHADGVSGIIWPELKSSLEIDGIEYAITGMEQTANGFIVETEANHHTLRFRSIANTMFMAVVYCISVLAVLHFIEALCKKFRYCETPFTNEIVEALRKLALSLIPMALLSTLTEGVTNSIMTGKVEIVVGIDLMTVILIILIFLLAAIFRYGTMLQQESDETL